MSDHMKTGARQHFDDGSSYNPNLDTITFGLTLPVKAAKSFIEDQRPSPKTILDCLARCIETQTNPLIQSALKGLFDCIYDRTTPQERSMFPNWFDSQ